MTLVELYLFFQLVLFALVFVFYCIFHFLVFDAKGSVFLFDCFYLFFEFFDLRFIIMGISLLSFLCLLFLILFLLLRFFSFNRVCYWNWLYFLMLFFRSLFHFWTFLNLFQIFWQFIRSRHNFRWWHYRSPIHIGQWSGFQKYTIIGFGLKVLFTIVSPIVLTNWSLKFKTYVIALSLLLLDGSYIADKANLPIVLSFGGYLYFGAFLKLCCQTRHSNISNII